MKKDITCLRHIYRYTFFLMLFALAWQTTIHLIDYSHGVYGYEYGFINEMLINYEGGFVRRGLFGELLFIARNGAVFSVSNAIVITYYLGFLLLSILVVRLFLKNGWSLYILPFPICLYVYLCNPYFLVGKRDCWLLLLAYLCFWLYQDYVSNKNRLAVFFCNISLLLALLLHEASLFFIFPFIASHDFYRQYCANRRVFKSVLSTVCHSGAVLFALPFIFLYHGNPDIVCKIWNSWAFYIPVDNSLIVDSFMSRTIGDWSLLDAAIVAMNSSWLSNIVWKIPVFPFNLYLFVCIYYFVTRFNTIHFCFFNGKPIDTPQLSNIVILQFCFLLPFMVLISSDFGRNVPLWVISSFMLFHFFDSRNSFPVSLTKCSVKIQRWIDKSSFLNSSWGYYILLITLPLGFMGANLSNMFPFIPLTLKHILMGTPIVTN